MVAESELRYVITYAFVDVYEDSYEHGWSVDQVNGWEVYGLKGKEYYSIEDLVEDIHRKADIFSDDLGDYGYIDGRIFTDEIVDVDNCTPSEEDKMLWRNGELDLYAARLDVGVHVVEYEYINGSLDRRDERELSEDDADALGLYTA